MGNLGAKAWAEDKLARQRGRVQIFNSTRPYGMDGWTMDRGEVKLEVWAFFVYVGISVYIYNIIYTYIYIYVYNSWISPYRYILTKVRGAPLHQLVYVSRHWSWVALSEIFLLF